MTDLDQAPPYVEVEAKRVYDEVPVEVDWHDYLARLRRPGSAIALNDVVRPIRSEATGLQYRCATAGTTSKKPTSVMAWPTTVGATLVDGSVTWVAEALSATSLRTTISSASWLPVTGLTLSAEANNDLRYVVQVAGGSDGLDYEVKHQVTLVNGENKEAVAVLPVRG